MQHIIDTHTFLWFEDGSEKLPTIVRDLIKDPGNTTQISIASFWEMGIKASTGKLPLPNSLLGLKAIAESQLIEILPITVQAISVVQQFPFHHKDPFDRIIAATVLTTGGVLLSADAIFDAYGVPRTWQVS